jgi:hypothetical protein
LKQSGLALNQLPFIINGRKESLASTQAWNAGMIEARTEAMVKRIIDIFAFERENVQTEISPQYN